MKKNKEIDNIPIDNPVTANEGNENNVKVKFKTTYIGKLGNYYQDKEYTLSKGLYQILKMDCEVIG